jgi:hypothetical protein
MAEKWLNIRKKWPKVALCQLSFGRIVSKNPGNPEKQCILLLDALIRTVQLFILYIYIWAEIYQFSKFLINIPVNFLLAPLSEILPLTCPLT